MALTLGDNFSYQGAKPLDARLNYSTVAAMKAVADATMYNGCLAYCIETDKTYQWKSTNTVDETLGKWREFQAGGGGTTYEAGDGIDITEDVISTKKSEAGDIDEIIDRYPTGGALVSIVNAFNNGDLYSTDEKMIGQWIDGKPVYQKTILFGNLPNNSAKKVPIGVNNIDKIVDFKAIAISENNAVFILPSSTCTNLAYAIECVVLLPSNEIQIITAVDRSTAIGYITVRYTKTTDSAIAIGSETEYSTDEKIVGTWIDGKPLYQKVVEFTITNSNTWTDYNHGISGIEKCVSMDCFAVYNDEIYTVGPKHNESFISGFFGKTSVSVSSKNYSNYTARCILRYTKTT